MPPKLATGEHGGQHAGGQHVGRVKVQAGWKPKLESGFTINDGRKPGRGTANIVDVQVGSAQNMASSQQRAGGPHIGGDVNLTGGRRVNKELPTVVPNVNGRRHQGEWGGTQMTTHHVDGDFSHATAGLVHNHCRVGGDDNGGTAMVMGFFAMKAQGNDGVIRLDIQHGQVGTILVETLDGLNNCIDAIGEHSFL